MKGPWTITLPAADAVTLAGLRLTPGIEVAVDGPMVWVRGKTCDEILNQALLRLPAVARYEWLPNSSLRLLGERIPSRGLPALPWSPLNQWFGADAAPAAYPGEISHSVALRLERSSSEEPPDMLLTHLDDWSLFAASAGEIRLKALRFAVNAAGEALIAGRPLPPLTGRRFVLQERVAVPLGFTWQPHVHPQVLRRLFAVADDDYVLWHEDGTFCRLHGEQFIPATRSAAWFTRKAFLSPHES